MALPQTKGNGLLPRSQAVPHHSELTTPISNSQILHNSSRNTVNLTPALLPQESNQTTANMMGAPPWNPNISETPSYPTDEILAAEYRAYLESYHSSAGSTQAPTNNPSSATLGYNNGHEENDKARRAESRDSSSVNTSPYGTANYASSDPYPPFNPTSIDFNLAHSGDLITSPDHHRSTVDSQQQHQQMLAVSPDSFSSFESPNSMGIPLAPQQPQYFSQDPYYGGGGAGYNGNQQPQQSSSPNWMNQPTAVHPQQLPTEYSYQHQGQPTYANQARPSASTNPFATTPHPGYQQQYPHQMGGVAPGQISSNPGGSRSAMIANVGQNQPQQ
jgi:hypothetical protein